MRQETGQGLGKRLDTGLDTRHKWRYRLDWGCERRQDRELDRGGGRTLDTGLDVGQGNRDENIDWDRHKHSNRDWQSDQCCSVAAGVSDCLIISSLSNQIFTASYVSGVSGAKWSMNYIQQEICALNGSTVFMNGTFTHPEHLTVNKSFWVIDPVKGVDSPDLSTVSSFSGRVEYFIDEQNNFALKLSNIMKKDEHKYCFRVTTTLERDKWIGTPGIKLNVTELHVESPGEVTEGESAVLTCKTTCSLTDPTFIWYKDGRPLTTEMIQKNQQLHLQSVSSEDAGSYSCAVRGSEHLPSTAQTLRVRHPPKSVSVSISPSGGIVEGSSVTLTCSSDGDPPVENYTWFKEGGDSPVGSGQSFSIINITADHTGLYYCEAQNAVGVQNGSVMIDVQR
ncbi:B-cell receptor CD22-like [Astyanax mexicanus]|uniref:B-cell receptor CD22-like n=1 Tax=Astyanax mexicanus TaxID=7994 RepID=UPI0020CB0C28|nr:B-cell receptor CD22-like [Astyanax mexicanus]